MTTFSHNDAFKKAKENATDDVHTIKKDIQGLLKRLQNLGSESKKSLFKDADQIVSTLSEMKDNLATKGCHQLKILSNLIKGHPVKSAFYIFVSGIILAKFFKKD